MDYSGCLKATLGEQIMADRDAEPAGTTEEARRQREVVEIQNALRGLRFGSINVIVQDGIVVQIDRVEKKRLIKSRPQG